MDKVVIITGAGRRLGRTFAIALSRQGYKIVAAGQTEEELQEIAHHLQGDFLTAVCDVTRSEDCERLVASAKEKFGTVDVLVNNAGVYTQGSFAQTPMSNLHLAFDVVVTGTAIMSKAALEVMTANRSGQIVNILDVHIKDGLPELGADGSHAVDLTVKRAKLELTNMLRQEAAQYNISVTSFFMKWVASDLDIDDNSKAPDGATHPRDAASYLLKAIEENHKETILPASDELIY